MKTQDLPADGRALPAAGGELSEAVRAAQEKLMALRRAHGVEARGRIGNYGLGIRNEEGTGGADPLLTSPTGRGTRADPFLASPTGRGTALTYDSRHTSETLVAHLRAAGTRRARQTAADDRQWLDELRITNYELGIKE